MSEKEIVEHINALCRARHWSLYRLAKESGITYSTLCTMLHKATAPSLPTLIKICQGFGISLSEFFDTGNTWSYLTESQKQHIRQWDSLTPDNQHAISKYMDFLLSEQ